MNWNPHWTRVVRQWKLQLNLIFDNLTVCYLYLMHSSLLLLDCLRCGVSPHKLEISCPAKT